MTLVLFVNYIFFGVDERTQVSYWLMTLADDTNGFNKFASGHYVFKMTLYYIRQGFWMPNLTDSTYRYNLYGFVCGVQFTGRQELTPTKRESQHDDGTSCDIFMLQGIENIIRNKDQQ
ncbi:hypothetical protein Ddye_000820 [Dipteronia dyeriana]|uniref:Uncharacterized protein n=1 Tax=Dipteronia dyeriana TaxID=168575 RepID=A0AAE0CSX6_9ROSI|nr:hypothetical protein Ddye_000820 [Dipteronia dyeriana]